jgi:hypothetical protein
MGIRLWGIGLSWQITIDDDVWAWLKGQAEPFEDTPNSVLRRIAKLDKGGGPRPSINQGSPLTAGPSLNRRLSGKILNVRWTVGARHALYHKDGDYYNLLTKFPGALFDPNGYVVFQTKDDYESSPYLRRSDKQLHVQGGISSLPGYVRVTRVDGAETNTPAKEE